MVIWFLTHRLPYAPNRGDRIRAYHILRRLSQRASVEVFSLVHDAAEAAQAVTVRAVASHVEVAPVPKWRNRLRGALRLASREPLTFSLLRAPALLPLLDARLQHSRPDVVLAYCSSMARVALQSSLRHFPLVVDMVDVDSEKWRDLARRAPLLPRLIYRREARLLRSFEGTVLDTAAATVAINQREVDALAAIRPARPVTLVSNGIDVGYFRPPGGPADRPQVAFCGVLDYKPNEMAALRLVQRIWPLVLTRRPDATLTLVGANPTRALTHAAASAPQVVVTGAVADVRPYLWASALSVAPLETARGIQNKVLEALAAGLPTIVSPAVAAGLPASVLPGVRSAASDDEFAAAIVEWLSETSAGRRNRAAAADLTSLTWDCQLEPLWQVLTKAAGVEGSRAGVD